MKCLICDHFHQDRICAECDCVVYIPEKFDANYSVHREVEKKFWEMM